MIANVAHSAHDNGPVLAMHANSFDAWRFATGSEADVIVHGLWNWGEHESGAGVPTAIGGVPDAAVDKNTGNMPTMQVLHGERIERVSLSATR